MNLYDDDSYYHLAVSRAVANGEKLVPFPWARFSLLTEGFGDKELLFHWVLAPFTRLSRSDAGGRVALVLLNASLAALLAWSSMRAIGPPGALAPLFLYACAAEFPLRTLRLRPEILSLALLVGAFEAYRARRARVLGLLALAYALSYVAVHVFVGLCLLWFLYDAFVERRTDAKMIVFPCAGAALGLVVHPQFPANLRIVWYHAYEFFRYREALDVGPEISSQLLYNFVALNAGWLAALWVAWRSRATDDAPSPDRRSANLALLAAVVFGALYLHYMRFAIYAMPFATLAVLHRVALAGGLGAWMRLPFRGRVPAAVACGACLLFAPNAWRWVNVNLTSAGVFSTSRRDEWRRVGSVLPAGARVAASWGEGETYAFWAPQARTLNVLDPGLMAVPFPKQFVALRNVLDGSEPDVPLAVAGTLESEYLAFELTASRRKTAQRLFSDPRVERLTPSGNLVFRVRPDSNAPFVLDWRRAPAGIAGPPPLEQPIDGWPRYPRLDLPSARGVEGYVDARRFGPTDGRVTFVRDEDLARGVRVRYELASAGPATLFLDGFLLASAEGSPDAVLGGGLEVSPELAPGRHRFTVVTAPSAPGRCGFYLLERARQDVR